MLRQRGPDSINHTVRTNYTLDLFGVSIPLIVTNRVFSAAWKIRNALPFEYYAFDTVDGVVFGYCTGLDNEGRATATVSENCTISVSTIYYVDQQAKFAVYKTITDKVHLNVSSEKTCLFGDLNGNSSYNMVPITAADYVATRKEELCFIINGSRQVMRSVETPLHPFGPRSGIDHHGSVMIDPEIRTILVFQQPPSQSTPYAPEIVVNNFYDYGNLPGGESQLNKDDGGLKDYFYPAWCRNLVADPVWRATADRRYQVSWFGQQLDAGSAYTPPAVFVDPLPRGNHVKHPTLGEAYQFVIDGQVHGAPDLTQMITAAGAATHDTTLCFPFSLL